MSANEQKYWLGGNKKVYFYDSELSTSVSWPTSSLAAAAAGGIRIRFSATTGSSTDTYIIPLFIVETT